MKFQFVKFYSKDHPDAKGDAELATYFAVTETGQAFRIGVTDIVLLLPEKKGEPFAVPEDWKPLTGEEWKALHLPVSVELLWGTEPPAVPVEPTARELTEAEKAIDAKYKTDLRWWRKGKIERLVKALEDSDLGSPFIRSTTTVVSEEFNSPALMKLLAAALDHDEQPEDPIEWRRSKVKSGKQEAILQLLPVFVDLVNKVMDAKFTKATAKEEPAASAPPPEPEKK